MARTLNETILQCTNFYLDNIDVSNPPSLRDIEAELVTTTRDACMSENQVRAKGDKLPLLSKLIPSQIAAIILRLYSVVNVMTIGENANPEYDLLAIYSDEGENAGLYDTDEYVLKKLVVELNYTITVKEMQEVLENIRLDAPRVLRTSNPDLVPVNNGIFNYATKELEPFSPEYVFLAKTRVNFNPNASNIVIHNDEDNTDWDIESWMNDLSDDPEIVNTLWEVLSAVVRPFVRWGKCAFLYSASGCSGKGTLTELMRQLVGSYAAIPITSFSNEFALEPLIRSNAVISDEQDVSSFVSNSGRWKAAVTNDCVLINRKFLSPISFKFYGFMVFCVNDMPKFRDKSESLFRRILFIPFDRCFTGAERKYIKEDYMHRPEVLEYVLYKVLNTDLYSLTEPERCKSALATYKEYNDPVRQFMEDVLGQCSWDFLPFTFLYELYKGYVKKNNPRGTIQGRNTFINELLNLLPNFDEWNCSDKNQAIRPGDMMSKPEPLIAEYDVVDWKNSRYTGNDIDMICMPTLKESYRGILRVKQ